MKTIALIFALLVGCSSDPPETGCKTDNDCKGDRVCRYGECTSPSTSTVPTGKPCGAVNIACNCAYTSAYPGQTTGTTACASGFQIFEQCSGYCGPGYPWRTVCGC